MSTELEAALETTRNMWIAVTPLGAEAFLLLVIVQLIVLIAAARAGGWVFGRLGQPQVVGEIAAGLLLGPSCLGRVAPDFSRQLFVEEVRPVLEVLGQLGLVFLMFLVGLEFDFRHLRRVGRSAGAIATAGIAVPFALGAGLAWLMLPFLEPAPESTGFVLFVATALSITAIPILARILMEFRLERTQLGALVVSAAAVDDALGWILLATVSAFVAGEFDAFATVRMLCWTVGFVAAVGLIIRPIVVRWLERTPQIGLMGFSAIVVAILAAAAATSWIGVFSVLGPFVFGAVLCDQRRLRETLGARLHDFVAVFFLPIFFTYTGLKTDVRLLDSASLWFLCGLVTLVACAGKMLGCGLAARLTGLSWRDSTAVAILMNTRALMGLIAITIGRQLGVIPDTVFCMLVIMALVTTFLTSPVLRRLNLSEDTQAPRS